MSPELIPIAVRAYPKPRRRMKRFFDQLALGASEWALVFDCETTVDMRQRLRVGSYALYRWGQLYEEGFFYDPGNLTVAEVMRLRIYSANRGQRVMTRDEWVEGVFLFYGWELSGRIIGFNLPFDISRIAIGHFVTRTRSEVWRGALSFGLTDNPEHPRILVKRVGPKAALIRFTEPGSRNPEEGQREARGGYFVDISNLGSALLSGSRSLKSLAETLGTETRKLPQPQFTDDIDDTYLDYAATDVQVTWECYLALEERYRTLKLSTPIERIHTEASVGKAFATEFGITPWAESDPGFPDWLTAAVMEAYYGGRAETHIRGQATCGVYVDFVSQYPTVFVLMHLDAFLTAKTIEWHDEDPDQVMAWLQGVGPDQVLDPKFWPQLCFLAEVAPDGDQLPTRARYGPGPIRNVAQSLRSGGPTQWYTAADLVASVLATGKVPKIVRVIRVAPGEPQDGLRSVEVADGVEIHPGSMVRQMVELRRQLKASEDPADQARAQALKITTNAVSYGTGVEMNPAEWADPRPVEIILPDGTTYTVNTRRTETQGLRFHPVISAFTASGGRLLLQTAMHLVHDAGGDYVLCDTDSLFIAAAPQAGRMMLRGAPDGTVRLLSWRQVDEIVARFAALDPYGTGKSILEVESENFDPTTGKQRVIWCYSIAAKRYALYTITRDGQVEIIRDKDGTPRRSEHGLGHLLSPTHSGRDWTTEFWEHLISQAIGIECEEPDFFDRPAIGRLSIASAHELDAFAAHNAGLDYCDQVRPFGFLLIAHPDPFAALAPGAPRCLVAAYNDDPDSWLENPWYDRGNRSSPAYRIRTHSPHRVIPGEMPVQTIRDLYHSYRTHPETKAADPWGRRAGSYTTGLMYPRGIEATGIERVGKEVNRFGGPMTQDPAAAYDPKACHGCLTSLVGRQVKWCSEVCRKRHSLTRERKADR